MELPETEGQKLVSINNKRLRAVIANKGHNTK